MFCGYKACDRKRNNRTRGRGMLSRAMRQLSAAFRPSNQEQGRMNSHRYFAAFLLSGVAMVASASQVIRFSSGRASVPLPGSFRVVVTGDDVVATFGANADHTLEL